MNVVIVTGNGDLLVSVSVRRATDANMVMVAGNNHFLVLVVMVVVVGRAADANVVMITSNNHFLVLIVMMVVVMMMMGRAADADMVVVASNNNFLVPIVAMVVGRAADANVVMVPRNNDLLVWFLVMMASEGMHNMLAFRRGSMAREITIVSWLGVRGPQSARITAMVVMVVMMWYARMMNMIIWKSGCQLDEDVYFASRAYHQTTAHSAALSDGMGSSDGPIRTNEDDSGGQRDRKIRTLNFPPSPGAAPLSS
jgi:hypothetical protein